MISNQLTQVDLEALRAIHTNSGPFKPNHVVRLELLGLVRDGPSGPSLTPDGRRALTRPPTVFAVDTPRERSAETDSLGRRKGGKDGRANKVFMG